MDLTGWLEYFVTGLETQMVEVKLRGEQVIRRDVLASKFVLNERQAKAVEFLLQHNQMRIQDVESLFPGTSRRTLQRDLKAMQEKGLLRTEGATSNIVYFLRV